MSKIEKIMVEVEKMRETMQNLIDEKENLLDEEVIRASKNLDEVLNKYYGLLKEKNK